MKKNKNELMAYIVEALEEVKKARKLVDQYPDLYRVLNKRLGTKEALKTLEYIRFIEKEAA